MYRPLDPEVYGTELCPLADQTLSFEITLKTAEKTSKVTNKRKTRKTQPDVTE